MKKLGFFLILIIGIALLPIVNAEYPVYVHVEDIPYWADNAGNAVYLATEDWKSANQDMEFYVATNPAFADIQVSWIKEFGTEKVGQALGGYIQVGLGDSWCGEWRPYSENHVAFILSHEMGHAFGHQHNDDPDSLMYPIALNTEYGLVEQEFTLTEGYAQYVPFCSVSDVTSFSYSVSVDDPTYGFDVYVVPSVDSFNDWVAGESFSYYSNSECFGENYLEYGGTCRRVANTGGLLIIMDNTLTEKLTYVTVQTQEISNVPSGYHPQGTSTKTFDDSFYDEYSDSDNDGIYDSVDVCVWDKETYNSYMDWDGCPDSNPNDSSSIINTGKNAKVSLSLFSDEGNGRSITLLEGTSVQFAGEVKIDNKNPATYEVVYINEDESNFLKKTSTDDKGFYLYYWTAEKNPATYDGARSTWKFVATTQVGSKILASDVATLVVISPDEKVVVPGWVKNNAGWWSSGAITDDDFSNAIESMIKDEIIKIPGMSTSGTSDTDEKIPTWIKLNAKWWSEGQISDEDFIRGLEYMIEKGIIKV